MIGQILAEEIEAVTGLRMLGEMTFFTAGLDSASIVVVHQRVQERLELEFPISAFFRHPTPHALSEYLAEPGLPEGQVSRRKGDDEAWTPQSRRALRARMRGRNR